MTFHSALPLVLGSLLCLSSRISAAENEWFAFDPAPDPFNESPIDLRHLNESVAGEHGRIAARDGQFIHSTTGEPVRFWAVNGPPDDLSGDALDACARRLAKYGVNLVRLHTGIFRRDGSPNIEKIRHSQAIVAAMKAHGIYSHFSIYFPLWMTPPAESDWLKGYDGRTHPFAALMFNPEFQERYREWWKALLLSPDAHGRRLVDEPAVFGLEMQNEDSFFFWTFNPDRIPDEQLRLIESRFAQWLIAKHGSLDAALERWGSGKMPRDAFDQGRAALRPLWNIFNEKTPRDRDTAAFLFETQRAFYDDTVRFLRGLGFKGLITASNWATASPEIFGPLEKWSYTAGDFIDRHGYFSITHKGENAAWSIRPGHVYSERSGLRFDPVTPGQPKQYVHPVMDPSYNDLPSMISETTWTRPNRFRGEAPLYYACYGSLQDSDAIVHFALDGDDWNVKPRFWMQPWTLMAPTQMAQFPAAALIHRRGLVETGQLLAKINLNTNDLLNLKGTPLPQDANFDELRLKDVPEGTEVKPGQRIDPLIHYAGRTRVEFTGKPTRVELENLSPSIDRASSTVRASTGELVLDYEKGLLRINAPAAQGASGNLGAAGEISLKDLAIQSPLDNAHIVAVALDDRPLATSRHFLVQAMSEERATGFATEPAENGLKRITDIGRNPWQVKALAGVMRFKRDRKLTIQPLDFNGYPKGEAASGTEIKLQPDAIYYLVTSAPNASNN